MSTLLLRLAAPLQSWGTESKFDQRSAGRAPSKSGIIGLCAAALGYLRDEDAKINKLAELKFGVRVDKPGTLIKDFHTARTNDCTYVTMRYYYSDAAFLVGLEGDEAFLREIEMAVITPMFPLFLGRRSCPPEGRVVLGVMRDTLRDALEKQPPIVESRQNPPLRMRIIMDVDSGGYFLRDLPHSFNPEYRKYGFRRVCEYDCDILPQSTDVAS